MTGHLTHLYPNAKGTDSYVMVRDNPYGTSTLFYAVPICEIRLSDMKVIWQADNLSSQQKKYISDFKKYLNQKATYTDYIFCIYFNGDMVEYSLNGKSIWNKFYQMLETAKLDDEPVDIPSCYLTRVPVVMDKNNKPIEYLWEDEHKFFSLSSPGTTIDDVLKVMDRKADI